ncbi:unnamed protein product [Eruca vesicaria subsp. sativa]|uniref:Uncharacterized protein n=1 Tax=Eruca vesicaria subsp. sativa TaxID=29727 RepID=A0ABC8JU28_ERUVS|nr:unnamed protein product [Eruca vesicaria subsp. sativa]
MSDVVMKEEGSDTLSDKYFAKKKSVDIIYYLKELEVVLPRYQPFNGYTSPFDFIIKPYKEYGSSNYAQACEPPPPQEELLPIKEAETELENLHLQEIEPLHLQDIENFHLQEIQMTSPSFLPLDSMTSPSFNANSPPDYSIYHHFGAPCQVTYTPGPPGRVLFLPYEQLKDALHAEPLLCAKIGIHCYNLENGTYFKRLGGSVPEVAEHTGVLTLQAFDLVRNCSRKFETKVWYAIGKKDCFHVITSRCRTLPPPPEEEEEKEESGFDTLSVDELFKGNMPDWLPGDNKLHYYEMKESEVKQAKEWLYLYAELAWYTKEHTDPYKFEYGKPFELRKIIVQTKEVVESMKEVMKLYNAVFYVSFKTRCGAVCNGIIRRTRDGRPEHLSLEAKCFVV